MKTKNTYYSFSLKDYVLIFLVITCLSSAFIAISIWMSQQDIESQFSQRSQTIHNTLLHRLNNIDAALVSLVGLNHGSKNVTKNDISEFSSDILDNFNFVDAIYISKRIHSDDQESFEEKMKSSGLDNYKITELDTGSKIIGKKTPYLYPIDSIEPYTPKTTQLIGANFNSNNEFTNDINKAITESTIVHTKTGKSIYSQDLHYFLLKAIYLGYFKPATVASRDQQLAQSPFSR